MKIYTRTGDDGTTGLFSGDRVPKTHARVEAYGAVDELNAALGVARAGGAQPAVATLLDAVQRQLFKLGADLATPTGSRPIARIDAADIRWLETEIDLMTARLPELKAFILPGGTLAAAQLQVARTMARRAERRALRVDDAGNEVGIYLNRLSDFLFTLARFENLLSGTSETEWHPG